MLENLIRLDTNALLWIQENLRSPILSSVLIPLTKSGDAGILFIAIGLLMIVYKKTRKAGILFLLSLAANFILNDLLIKNIVARQRPFDVIESLKILINRPHSFSFPSGHTSSAFACMTTLWFTKRKIAPLGLIYAILMGFSRMYVGVHFPSDVIFGAIVGILVSVFVCLIYKTKRE